MGAWSSPAAGASKSHHLCCSVLSTPDVLHTVSPQFTFFTWLTAVFVDMEVGSRLVVLRLLFKLFMSSRFLAFSVKQKVSHYKKKNITNKIIKHMWSSFSYRTLRRSPIHSPPLSWSCLTPCPGSEAGSVPSALPPPHPRLGCSATPGAGASPARGGRSSPCCSYER